MTRLTSRSRLAAAVSPLAFCLAFTSGTALAQETPATTDPSAAVTTGEQTAALDETDEAQPSEGTIVVTGFRASLTELQIEKIGARSSSAKSEAAPKAEAAKEDRVAGMPKDYEGMTVAQINEAAAGWNRPMLEAALEYEQAHGKRKGAISAIEHALAAKEDH